ncbi:MAG: zinc-dependent metalloprotease [Acidimicrobiia bacterium]
MGSGTDVAVPDPIDWSTARRVARFVAGRDALSDSYLGASIHDDFSALTVRAEDLVAEFTGLRPPGRVAAEVLDRKGWVDANIDSMRRLLEPLMHRVGARMAHSPFAPLGRQIAATEMGGLVGYLSQRVLGQYDLLVPEEDTGDAVYYVGPNILALEKRFAFRPLDFRFWIAIHEVTHRAQFAGVPWMRAHFFSLVQQAFAVVDPDPSTLARAISKALDEVRRGRNPLDDGGIVGLFASEEQKGAIAQVQALMSLLEGHGNVVMSELGRRHVAGEERMARILHQRRHARGITGQLHKLLGLEQKLRQYEIGERFVHRVVDRGGFPALDRVWDAPENLPTSTEIDDPDAWFARVTPRHAVG